MTNEKRKQLASEYARTPLSDVSAEEMMGRFAKEAILHLFERCKVMEKELEELRQKLFFMEGDTAVSSD